MRPPPARREAPSLFEEVHHLFGVVHSPVPRSAPSVRRERLSQTQCRNGCEIKKKCELVAAKRIENLIYTRAVLRCNAPASNSSAIASPASNSSAIAPWPATASRWRSATAPRPATAPLRRPGQQRPASNISAATVPWQASSRWRSVTAPRLATAPLRLHASNNSATAPLPATNLIRRRKVLRFG